MGSVLSAAVLLVAVVAVLTMLRKFVRTVPQAHVGVVTRFGKYQRSLHPGLSLVNPFLDKVSMVIPVQNQTATLQFAAITEDQAAVNFTATLIYTVAGTDEETIVKVAFKFIDDESFTTALTSAVEASVREFVASKKQAEVLGLRQTIVEHAKSTLDDQLADWGYLLVDLTVNDIAFDADVMKSMSRVVAAKNAQTAAEFEGQALLIARTKQAEAEGQAQVIAAAKGAQAAELRGQGIAAQREAIAAGLSASGIKLGEAGLDMGVLTFSMWTEALRDIAINGRGNTIFLDGSLDAFDQSQRRTQALLSGSPAPRRAASADAVDPDGEPALAPQTADAGEMPAGAQQATDPAGPPAGHGAEAAQQVLGQAAVDALGKVIAGDVAGAKAAIVDGVKKAAPAGYYPHPKDPSKLAYWTGTAWRD